MTGDTKALIQRRDALQADHEREVQRLKDDCEKELRAALRKAVTTAGRLGRERSEARAAMRGMAAEQKARLEEQIAQWNNELQQLGHTTEEAQAAVCLAYQVQIDNENEAFRRRLRELEEGGGDV